MLLCPVDTPVQILKSTNFDGWSAVSDEEVEVILPAAAYALAKIHMHLEVVWLSEENEIKEGLVRAFRSLLSNPGDWRTSLSELQFETLETLDVLSLEELFSEEDEFVKDDVMRFFKEFYEHGGSDFALCICDCYEGVYLSPKEGLRINLEKSELILVGRVENIDDLAMEFGCRVGSLPSTYLGSTFGCTIKNQVIRGKYREERGGWCSQEVREVYGVGLWKGIRINWDIVGTRISFLVGGVGGRCLGPLG
ncbi:hypothetical protein CK203_067115 [Vitis vinifera]|uniref:Uncharacterized protein n=1 Tax=Vitis vinifera TaxID=29760 RepID=A0A438F4Z0_VITVI|nr:hypothetical protein CK203_067115 [Vitis vinifera]